MISLRNAIITAGFIILLLFFVPIDISPLQNEGEFKEFLQKYNKSYDNETEYQYRLEAFKNSLKTIAQMNTLRTSNSSALYGITKYSDMTAEEFADMHLQEDYSKRLTLKEFHHSHSHHHHRRKRKIVDYPLKVDWREEGAVTSVNNQYSCGACWAFSVVEMIESMNAIKTKQLQKLSTQQLIDCAGYTNDGCNGGDVCTLLKWMVDKNVTVRNEEEYPMRWKNQKCKVVNDTKGIQIKKFACDYLDGKEDYILATIASQGPVAVAINALSWQNYIGGIIQYHCSSHPLLLNHAVQIVGYNAEADIPHYIVRNSWGEDFGNKGYLYIAIGKNLCGLANEVSAIELL